MLIVGLGNPGERYDRTRHNVGFELLDLLSRRWDARSVSTRGPYTLCRAEVRRESDGSAESVFLMKPQTYMNLSGRAILHFLGDHPDVVTREVRIDPETEAETPGPVDRFLVVVDDMSLDVGRVRFRAKGSTGGHNGLASIEEIFATSAYPRLRIGIGPAPDAAEWVDFVLTPFEEDERAALDEALGRAADGVTTLLEAGIDQAMTRHNG